MFLYRHELKVVVLSPDCSSDKIEKLIEAAACFRTRGSSVSATTDPENRALCPGYWVPDEPEIPKDVSRKSMAAYYTALDAWIDTLPRADMPSTWKDVK